jgi:hypothetical protein
VKPPRMQLLCDPNPMCYGATGALLAVLDDVDACRLAMGSGVSAELLRHDPAVDEWLDVDVKSESQVARVLDSRHVDAALVVSNTANLHLYAARGVPVFFVDILYWLGSNKGPERSRLLEAEFVQAFPGVHARVARLGMETEAEVIGPVVRAVRPVPPAERKGTLVHLGGGASRWIVPGGNSRFASMARGWVEAALPDLPRPVHIALGKAAAVEAGPSEHPDLTLGPLPQPSFHELLGRSELYITTPGLGGVFEGMLAGIPTLLLPPQNATQVLQLATYEQAGIVAPGVNLPTLDDTFPVEFRGAGEDALTAAVLRSLERIRTEEVNRQVIEHLRTQRGELPMRESARQSFMARLGPPGPATVARAIHRFWNERWM